MGQIGRKRRWRKAGVEEEIKEKLPLFQLKRKRDGRGKISETDGICFKLYSSSWNCRYADSSSSESEISRGTPQSDESESDPEFRPTKKKSSKPAERRRHVPPPKRPKLTKPKGKSANKSPVAELNSELSVGG